MIGNIFVVITRDIFLAKSAFETVGIDTAQNTIL